MIATLTLNPAIDLTVTLDALVPGTVHRARAVRADAGGKGVNVAACLADWGLPVSAFGLLGAGNDGAFRDLFARKGIVDKFVRCPGETRTNVKLLDAARGDTTDVNLPGLAVPDGALARVADALDGHVPPGGLAVLAGSLPGGLPADAYAQLTARLRARDLRVVLDASGPALAAALAAGPAALPFAVKPNRHELEDWAGRPLPDLAAVAAAAEDLRRRGIPLVVVSLGAEGALFVTQAAPLHARAPAVRMASTVGAGDALVAGLTAALAAGEDLAGTARLALAFAAGKLSREGANLPARAEVEALAATIRVAPLAP
ncbi:1-phosphofructokinase [Methylobacterium sp. JK268]